MVEVPSKNIFRDIRGISELIRDMLSDDSWDSVFEKVSNFLQKFIKFDAFLGAIVDWETNRISFEYILNIRKNIVYEHHTLPIDEKATLTGWVIKNGKTLYIRDTRKKEELPANLKLVGEPMRSWIGIPIMYKNDVIGVISVQGLKPNMLTMDDVLLIKWVVDVLSPVYKVKIADENLRAVEEKEAMIEEALSPMGVVQDGKLVYVNKQVEDFLGCKKDDIIGKNFIAFSYPDDREKLLQNYERRLDGMHAPSEYMARFISKNGEVRWGFVKAKKIKWNERNAVAFTIMDISELKRYADSLREMEKYLMRFKTANGKDELWSILIKGIQKIFDVKEIFAGMLEGTNIKIIKKIGYEDVGDKIKINESRVIEYVVKNNKPKYRKYGGREEYIIPISTEEKVLGVVYLRSNKIMSRNLIRIFVGHFTATLKTLEYREMIEESRNILSLMLRMVTHDLQNALTIIQGYSELLKETYDKEFIEEIEKALKKAEEIVDRTKFFSKLEAYKIDKNMEEIELKSIIEEIFKELVKIYNDAKINIAGDTKIKGYPLLKNVFENIIGNAYKYGATEVKVRITKPKNRVRIKIADNGPGIPEEKRETIFGEFTRGDSPQTGSGLGLWITKKIVELHHGKIWVEENKPKGSIFVIEIPTS